MAKKQEENLVELMQANLRKAQAEKAMKNGLPKCECGHPRREVPAVGWLGSKTPQITCTNPKCPH